MRNLQDRRDRVVTFHFFGGLAETARNILSSSMFLLPIPSRSSTMPSAIVHSCTWQVSCWLNWKITGRVCHSKCPCWCEAFWTNTRLFLFTHHQFEKGPGVELQDASVKWLFPLQIWLRVAVVRLWDADEQGKLLCSAQDRFEHHTICVEWGWWRRGPRRCSLRWIMMMRNFRISESADVLGEHHDCRKLNKTECLICSEKMVLLVILWSYLSHRSGGVLDSQGLSQGICCWRNY
jgi:hypothetical protein